MKIAHINNVANVPYTLAKEQERRGHEVKVFNLTKSHKYWSGNILKPWDRLRMNWKEYDVVFAHACSVVPAWLDKVIGVDNVIYWHHGTDVRGESLKGNEKAPDSCKLHNKPHIVSTPDLLKYCPTARWIPNPIDLEYWKSSNEGKTTLDLGLVKETPWQEMRDFLDRYAWFREFKGYPVYSYLATQAMAFNKPMTLEGIDWSLYPEQPDLMKPREYCRKYHDVRSIVTAVDDLLFEWEANK